MYKLKTTSLSAKFYSWIWRTEITKFKTMCPYFWRYILTILFLPVILILKFLFDIIPSSKKVNKSINYLEYSDAGVFVKKVFKPSGFWDVVSKICKWIFFVIAGIVCLALVAGMIIAFIRNPMVGFSVLGIVFLVILFLALMIYLFSEKDLGYYLVYPFKLFGNMIYSLYKNICPLINWEN